MKSAWTEEQQEKAARLQQALLLAAVAVAVDELNPAQFKRLRLIMSEIRDLAENGRAADCQLVADIKRISGVALHQSYEAVLRAATAADQ
jgi:hypothetical protein